MKTLVVYCTHNMNQNVDFFLKHGHIQSDDIDFIICFNGLENYNIVKQLTEERQNETNKNVKILVRSNIGLDFGAWSDVLLTEDDDKLLLYTKYDYFILLNNTCRGPFLPSYCVDNWASLFTNLINNEVKLVGPTINFYKGKPHVQSYFLCTDKIGLELAINNNIITKEINVIYNGINLSEHRHKDKFIQDYEIGFSKIIIENGYNIKCLLKGYDNLDYRKLLNQDKICFDYGIIIDDACYDKKYFGISFHPYEVIFYKANRHIANDVLEKYTKFHS